MGAGDVYETINQQDEATLQRLIERLEFRGKDPTFIGYRDAYLQQMRLDPAASVLDLGCGTGVVARALAVRDGWAGQITGVDQSPAMIDAARLLAAQEPACASIDFRVGDVHALELPDGAFDAVIAHTLVSHVTRPLRVLREAARVTCAGGTVTIFDGDYASLTFASADPALGRAMEEGLVTAIVSKPRVMRDLPRLLAQAGLTLVASQAHVYAEVGVGSFFPGLTAAYAPLVARAGILPQTQVDAWLDEQRQAVADGIFFAACNYYAYVARR